MSIFRLLGVLARLGPKMVDTIIHEHCERQKIIDNCGLNSEIETFSLSQKGEQGTCWDIKEQWSAYVRTIERQAKILSLSAICQKVISMIWATVHWRRHLYRIGIHEFLLPLHELPIYTIYSKYTRKWSNFIGFREKHWSYRSNTKSEMCSEINNERIWQWRSKLLQLHYSKW